MVRRQPRAARDATARAVAALIAGDGPPDVVTRKRDATMPQCRLRGELVLAIHAAGLYPLRGPPRRPFRRSGPRPVLSPQARAHGMAEAGVPGQEAYTLTGMVAPGGTPQGDR